MDGMPNASPQTIVEVDAQQQDRDYLTGLMMFHYLGGGFSLLWSLIIGSYVFVAAMFVNIGLPPGLNPSPEQLASPSALLWGFVAPRALLATGLFVLSAAMVASGKFLSDRRHFRFCLATAVVECLFIPYGTVLGIVTLFVLRRPSIRAAFGLAAGVAGTRAPCPCSLHESKEISHDGR